MRLAPKVISLATFLLAASLSFHSATLAVSAIETRSGDSVRRALEGAGHFWASVTTDGLLVTLSGTAPTEAARFRAISLAATVVDAQRIIDLVDVTDPLAIAPPEFSIEILRNDDGISIIGLIPASTDRASVIDRLTGLAGEEHMMDMLESSDHPVPEGWASALAFGLDALKLLPRSKITIGANRVSVTAITDSASEKAKIETELARKAPAGLKLALQISAPRPVITPFTLRFLIDANGPRFDACSADTEKARTQILAAATAAQLTGKATCTIGMGVPTPQWADAAAMGIAAMADLGAGSITFSDADISLIAAETVSQADFDRVVGELESNLPDVFSLHASLTQPATVSSAANGTPEFSASLSSAGKVQLRGRLTDDRSRNAVESFARARFGNDAVFMGVRLDEELPDGWPLRALAALEALAELESGSVKVLPDLVLIEGVTGSEEAGPNIARLLATRLGETEEFDISITYDEKLNPLLGLPTAVECVTEINAMLAAAKINFEPGSAVITKEGTPVLDKISARMKDCSEFPMEIGGHTDSQGSEGMNLSLSKERAQAVLAALIERRVLTGNLTAQGYGETDPIADNETEAGREANRRIEFTLLAPEEPLPELGNPLVGASGAAASAEGVEAGEGSEPSEVVAVEADENTPTPQPRPEGLDGETEGQASGDTATEGSDQGSGD